MNEQNISIQGATSTRRQVETWLSDHAPALHDMAAALTAGPIVPHFSREDLVAIMARKVWLHSVCDARFFKAGDLALLKAAWLEAVRAILDGNRYILRIHILRG